MITVGGLVGCVIDGVWCGGSVSVLMSERNVCYTCLNVPLVVGGTSRFH